jgi:DNA-binding protein H-NS
MEQAALNSMSIDQLWRLHEEVAAKLAEKIAAEKVRLDARLRELQPQSRFSSDRARRAYPPVFPKYRNPKDPAETWSGRGKQPHWVRTQLEAGKKLDEFLIGGSPKPLRGRTGRKIRR